MILTEAADKSLPLLHFTTAPHQGRAAFGVWEQRVAGFYDTGNTANVPTIDQFHLETFTWHLGEVLAAHSTFSHREQARPARKIRADQMDHYRLILQIEGQLRVDTGDRRLKVDPGQLLLTDMARPETFSVDPGANITIFLPREPLDAAIGRNLDLHGLVPRGAAAILLAAHVSTLVSAARGFRQSEAPALSQATLHLVASSVPGAIAELPDAARPAIDASLLRQACRYVDAHLSDTNLSPQALCAQFKISRATLYRLFEPYGGVSAYVRERRLSTIHALLSEPERRHHLQTLADAYHFSDAAQLSRAFKQQFGYTPTDARGMGTVRTGAAGPTAREETVLGDWLRGLRL